MISKIYQSKQSKEHYIVLYRALAIGENLNKDSKDDDGMLYDQHVKVYMNALDYYNNPTVFVQDESEFMIKYKEVTKIDKYTKKQIIMSLNRMITRLIKEVEEFCIGE